MLKETDQYFANQSEPEKSCLQALRSYILSFDANITEAWKYRMPFYCYKGKMCCYLWTNKKTNWPYMGIVEGKRMKHPQLIMEKRARMKILLFDPLQDIPLATLQEVLDEMVIIYQKGK